MNMLNILTKIEIRMFATAFYDGETISQLTLILLKWLLTFLPFEQCHQNMSEVSPKLATPSQLVEVTYQMILWKVERHCAHGYQLV